MKTIKSIGINFVGGIWTGVLIVLTTPFYLTMLGLEGFGLIGFWQLLLFISLIFDFGLGASLVREFARYKGNNEQASKYRELFSTLQLFYVFMAILVMIVICLGSSWLAFSWLKLDVISAKEVSFLIKLMSASIALQFVTMLYSNGLMGLQKQGAMNAFQMLGNTLKFLGGLVVLFVENSITLFFAYQVVSALVVCWLTRRRLIQQIGKAKEKTRARVQLGHVRQLSGYSAGMFLTAVCGLLLANADRIVLSKLVSAGELGRYTLAFSAAGLLQMVILAFYRSYFPRFSELKAAGDVYRLKLVYYQGCRYVGAIIVPTAIAACVFAPELFRIWVGKNDQIVVVIFRLLIIGTTCSGLMWLPAALQQAVGWTKLHVALMVLALVVGIPCLIWAIQEYGIVGATSMVLVHGAIEITLGLWLMNSILYPGENIQWYTRVLFTPLAICLPIALGSATLMPSGLTALSSLSWMVVTGLVLLFFTISFEKKFGSK